MAYRADWEMKTVGEPNGTNKVSAIIAEYNPFHNGHKYHIDMTRRNGADFIIAVMSGALVQRGDVAVFDKHFRARQAVLGGADLVIELPYPFSCSCAEVFAKAAVSIISRLGVVDELSFGCETDDIYLLKKCADISYELSDCEAITDLTSHGFSYPAAFERVVSDRYGEEFAGVFRSPNSTLAIEYLKALRLYSSGIKPFALKRAGTAHDSDMPFGGFASASYIRGLIRASRDVSQFVPYDICQSSASDINNMGRAIFMRLTQIVQSGEYKNVPDFSHELAARFIKAAGQLEAADHNALLDKVKTKSFTRARASRAFLNAYLGITHDDLKLTPHARVLALSENGQLLLREIKSRNTGIEVSTSLSDFSGKRLCELDELSCRFQGFCRSDEIVSEYTRKFCGFISD